MIDETKLHLRFKIQKGRQAAASKINIRDAFWEIVDSQITRIIHTCTTKGFILL